MTSQKIARTTYGKRRNGRATRAARLDDDEDDAFYDVLPPSSVEVKKPPSSIRTGSLIKGKEPQQSVRKREPVRRPTTTAHQAPSTSVIPATNLPTISQSSRHPTEVRPSLAESNTSDEDMEVSELIADPRTMEPVKSNGKRKEPSEDDVKPEERSKRRRTESISTVTLPSNEAQPTKGRQIPIANSGNRASTSPQTLKRTAPSDAGTSSPTKRRLSMNPRPVARPAPQPVEPLSSPTVSSSPGSPATPPQTPRRVTNGRTSTPSPKQPVSPRRPTPSPKHLSSAKATQKTPQPSTPTRSATFPSTPTPKAKDLSDLFNSLPMSPSAPPGTPSRVGLVRSMSRRSPMKPSARQTSQASSPPLFPATPMARFITPTQTDDIPKQESQSSQQSEATPPHRAASRTASAASSTQKTYARSRSFLMEGGSSRSHSQSQSQSLSMSQGNSQDLTNIDFDGVMDDLALPTLPEIPGLEDFGLAEVTESYAEKAARWGIEDDRVDEGLQDPADLRSITFQRSKGENRRFADEVGFLLDGLKADQGLAVRRSSALQFVEKMLDHDFIRKLKAVDGISKSWEALRHAGAGEGDRVLDGALYLYLALITRDHRNAEPLLPRMDDIVYVADHGLQISQDEDALAGARVPKPERGMMATLRTLLARAALDSEDVTVTTRRLVSTFLEPFTSLNPTPLTMPLLKPTVDSLREELRPFAKRLKRFAEGGSLIPKKDEKDDSPSIDLSHTDNCLHVVEVLTLRRTQDDQASEAMDTLREYVEELIALLLALAIGCRILTGLGDEKRAGEATRCLISSLRVLVNLSSTQAEWCNALLSQADTLPAVTRLIVQSDKEASKASETGGRERAHDVLCLGLALLTNLVEQVSAARDAVRDTMYNPSCAGEAKCTYACQCSKRVSALRCLVDLYVGKAEEAERCAADGQEREGAEAAFIAGHCSVLLSILGLNNQANIKIIVKALPGNTKRDKVDRLLTAVRDFTDAQKDAKQAMGASKRSRPDENDVEEDEDGVERAEDVHMSEDEEDEKARTVAQIIEMLEELRDAA